MAKQKSQNQSIIELDTSIMFDGRDYSINAAHADAAGSVDNVLVIEQHDALNNAEDIEFNGSNSVSLSVVPRSGGVFSGPIQVPDFESLTRLDEEQKNKVVLNREDIEKRIINLTGLPAINWTGKAFKIEDFDDSVYSSFKIVSGKDSNFKSFQKKVANDFYYLYLAQDTGNIYLRVGLNGDDPEYVVLVRQLDKVSNAENLVPIEKDDPNTPTFTAGILYTRFNDIEGKFNKLDLTNETSELSTKLNAISERINQLETKINNIVNGQTTVSKASWAGNADRAKYADNAGDADKVDGKHAYDLQKVIAVGSTAPTNPVEGDIWIKYSK